MIRNLNDGSASSPYLRTDICYSNVTSLPGYSSGPHGDDRELHNAVHKAGYKGIQDGKPVLCKEIGLNYTMSGRIVDPEDAEKLARKSIDDEAEGVTVHVGWGTDSDDHINRLLESILIASGKYDVPIYIETHRATATQDMHRTVQMTRRFPEIRFNADFSHWYNGLEMVYGDINWKFDYLAPVFDRVRFFHGRIADPGCIQVKVNENDDRPFVHHFREMWTRSMAGFLKSAGEGDFIVFAPELLGPEIHYARLIPDQSGKMREESDRWEQAALYVRIAEECWDGAQRRVNSQNV